MVDALPRAEIVIVEGAGHLPWLEDPAAFGRIVRGFVAGVSGRPQSVRVAFGVEPSTARW